MTEGQRNALQAALTRCEVFADPTDPQCGVDGIAREASRLYFESWIIPHLQFALGLTADEQGWLSDDRAHRSAPEDHVFPMYRSPSGRLRAIKTPQCPGNDNSSEHLASAACEGRCFYCGASMIGAPFFGAAWTAWPVSA